MRLMKENHKIRHGVPSCSPPAREERARIPLRGHERARGVGWRAAAAGSNTWRRRRGSLAISPCLFSGGGLCCAELRHPFKCCLRLFLAAAQQQHKGRSSFSFLSVASPQQESRFLRLMEANSHQERRRTTDIIMGFLLIETLPST